MKTKANKTIPVPARVTDAADAFMARLKHSLKTEIEAGRQIVRGISPAITEEIVRQWINYL